ncbi:MAG: arginine deiminase-related protein [Phycisphaerales bacterium]
MITILHTTDTILMVRPAACGSNPETAESNVFQSKDATDPVADRAAVTAEFDGFVDVLRRVGVNVLVLEDSEVPAKPDAVFPNNWFSTHADGRVLLYPMLSANRRHERRTDALAGVLDETGVTGIRFDSTLVDEFEHRGQYLESTGSVVFDHVNRVAYACRSPRTDDEVLARLCELIGYEPVAFDAFDESGVSYYHTNVMMSVGTDFAVVCLEAVSDDDRENLKQRFRSSGHDILEITREQAARFAGNVLELRTAAGDRVLALSDSAFDALGEKAAILQARRVRLAHSPIPTIERLGGGSARCMIAEIFTF